MSLESLGRLMYLIQNTSEMKQMLTFLLFVLLLSTTGKSQDQLNLQDVLTSITTNHPDLKGFNAQIRSLDEAAKGAKNWEPPLLSTGLWMTPYNPSMWKKQNDGSPGMGQYMISAEQMFPNTKMQNAELKYMQSLSTVEKERKNATVNDLFAQAKKSFYQWIVIKKKLKVLEQDERVLDFMIKDAELRYKNNLGKISAYYKAKASLGNIQTTRIMLENEITQKRISLNTLMNRDKNVMFDIDTTYTIQDYSSIQLDSTIFLNSRSDIKAVAREIQLTGLQQDVEKAKQRPEYGVRFDHMFGFGGLPMQYSLMGMVKLPIGKSTRASRANIESLEWKTESLNQQKQGLINEASGMAEGMKSEIASRKKQIELYENSIIPALRKNFQTTQLGYQNNTEEMFELYDGWATLNMTQLQYLDQLQQLLVMQAEFEKILEVK
jgi:outer membrane protein, heavy metal efflux system